MKLIYRHFCFIIFYLIFLSSCSNKNINTNQEKQIVGVKIYVFNGDFDQLFDDFQSIGINTLVASVDLLSNEKFKTLAKKKEMQTFAILPVFYAPDAIKKDSSLYAITQYGKPAEKEWVKFVCPSNEDYIDSKVKYINTFVETHKPDAISLDFIRHFAYWEKIYPNTEIDSIPNTCFDEKCITKFCYDIKTDLPDEINSPLQIYKWIQTNHYDEWVVWKSDLITSTVKKIVARVKNNNPEILINLHAVPWREDDFDGAIKKITGQNFEELSKYVDYISPMTYSHMVKRKPQWINSVVKEIKKSSGTIKIIPSIQVGIAYLSDEFSALEFEECLNEALKEPSAGVIFWNWDALYADKSKLEIVKNKFRNN